MTLVTLATAWPNGLPTKGGWDPLPLICAALLLMAARAAGIRLRWWGVALAAAGGVPCATLAAHFGAWATLAVPATVYLFLKPVGRARRRS